MLFCNHAFWFSIRICLLTTSSKYLEELRMGSMPIESETHPREKGEEKSLLPFDGFLIRWNTTNLEWFLSVFLFLEISSFFWIFLINKRIKKTMTFFFFSSVSSVLSLNDFERETSLPFVTILLLLNSFVTLVLILSQNQSPKDGNPSNNSEGFFQNPIEIVTWISFGFQILLFLIEVKQPL